MKGMISGLKRMEIHDGSGLRTTVFFKGCPLRCIWCHNPESISFEKEVARFRQTCIACGACGGEVSEKSAALCPVNAQVLYGREYGVAELTELLLEDKPFFENSGGGVTLSGGECLAQPDFAVALARSLWENGISVYIDTCGYVKREILERIIPYTDMFLYDIKAVTPEVHRRCTGRDNAQISENLCFLCERGCRIEVRYPLVMGYNDEECEKIGAFLRDRRGIERVKVLPYHAFSASRYEALGAENTLPDAITTAADVQNAVACLRSFGLQAIGG